jgi:precorrin-6A/cobalt-precorrin-6A reductase
MRINLWLLERPTEFKNINSVDSYEKLIKKLKSISME